jgi:two-component system, NtrC family, sensor histidine kinase HydH
LHDPRGGRPVTFRVLRSIVLVPLSFSLVFALFIVVFLKAWTASRSIIDYDAEHSMEVIAGGVLESLALQESLAEFDQAEGISAVALYDAQGEAMKDRLFVGRAPERIDISRVVAPYHVTFMRATQTLVLIRPRRSFPLVPAARTLTLADLRSYSRRPHLIVRATDFIYVEADGRGYGRAQALAATEAVLGTVLVGALCLSITILLLKNQRYREKISKEQDLIRLGEAARTLTHEIRNPLASIRVQTELLRALSPDEGRRELQIVEQEVQRLSYLVEKTGDFVRDPLGRPSVLDLDDFLRGIAGSFGESVRYERVDAEGPARVVFDPHRLRSVVENLLKNGLEWSIQGQKRPVEMRLLRRQDELIIEVRDHGPGIPRRDRGKVFEPLFTTRTDGWGLGLSIARQFVEAARGRIEISSPVGGGTAVTVTVAEARE